MQENFSHNHKLKNLTKNQSITIDDVNKMIPFLESTFIRIHQLNAQVKDALNMIGCSDNDFDLDELDLSKNSHKENEGVYDVLTDLKLFLSAIQSSVLELSKTGCSIKNLESGHVEWLYAINDEPMSLTWRLGDTRATLMKNDIPATVSLNKPHYKEDPLEEL